MEPASEKIKRIVAFLQLRNSSVEVDEVTKRISILTDEDEWFTKLIPDLIKDLKYLCSIFSRHEEGVSYVVDINNYRKERERLIVELAKAAAQKAVTNKQEVQLPAMNAFERRLVHTELSMRPDVKTESTGEGRERSVIVKPL